MTPETKRHFRILWFGALCIQGFVLLAFLVLLSLLGNSPKHIAEAFLLFPSIMGHAWLDWNSLVDILPYLLISIGLMAYGLFILKKHACLLFWMGFLMFCFCGSAISVYVATMSGVEF
jgi:hypothetical protein